jgi:hypothetical protein
MGVGEKKGELMGVGEMRGPPKAPVELGTGQLVII